MEQAVAYEAAFRQFYNEPWMAGMFWWFWPADPWASGPCDTGYSPRQKPAEDVLRAWYGGPPRQVEPVLFPDYDRALTVYQDGLASGLAELVVGGQSEPGGIGAGRRCAADGGATGALGRYLPAADQSLLHR